MLHSHVDYVDKPFLATAAIGGLLATGRLNLFLGSGVSSGFGLPDWALLIARLLGKGTEVEYVEQLRAKSDAELMAHVDTVDDGTELYASKVHAALYESVDAELSNHLPRSPLLLAVAALLTGSCRGRIERVFTYNYDNLLEQYIEMLGYACCVRTQWTDFAARADVEINHVHGFLPQAWKPGQPYAAPILSEKSYRNRRAGIDRDWPAAVAHSLYSKAALMIGLSGDDSATLDVLKRAQENLTRVADYHGYWLMSPDAYQRNQGRVIEIGMCPVPVEILDFPRFVFGVCQEAIKVSYPFAASSSPPAKVPARNTEKPGGVFLNFLDGALGFFRRRRRKQGLS